MTLFTKTYKFLKFMDTKQSLKLVEVWDNLPDYMKTLISDLVFSKSPDERKIIVEEFNTKMELNTFKLETMKIQTEKAFNNFVDFVESMKKNKEAEDILAEMD